MLTDLLEDLFGDLIIKGIRRVYDQLHDYSLFHPRRAAVGKALILLLIVLGGTGWFALRAWIAWKAEDVTRMELNLILGLLYLVTIGFVCLRRLLRRRKARAERMDDSLTEEEKLRIDMTKRCRCLDKRMW